MSDLPLYSVEQIDAALEKLARDLLSRVRENLTERRKKEEEMFSEYNSAQVTTLQIIRELLEHGEFTKAITLINQVLVILENVIVE